MAMATEPLMDL